MESISDRHDVTRRNALRGAAGIALGAAGAGVIASAVSAQSATPVAGASVGQTATLTTAGAMTVLQAALAKAQELGVPEVVAVLDAAGVLKAFIRMDGAPNSSNDLAFDKAFTAASFHAPTDQFGKNVSADPAVMASLLKAPHITLLGGGYPISAGDVVIGGIGCSGGSQEQDMQCAQAGLAALTL
jgi:glc operon protein GlcG